MFHYTYISTDGDRYYIGARSCECLPKNDKYLGSFYDKTFSPTKKYIVGVFTTRKRAEEHELYLQEHHKVVENDLFVNRCYRKNGFNVQGRTYEMTDDHKKALSESHKGLMVGEKNHRYGKPGTRLGAKNSEYQKQRAREGQLGKPKSEKTRRKLSEAKRDKTIRYWVNEKTGENFTGTTYELAKKQNKKAEGFNRVAKGSRRQNYGWICSCLL